MPENLVETQYYRDTRYMTLDRDADWLWQEYVFRDQVPINHTNGTPRYLLMSTGNIRIPDGKGNMSLKSISM